MADQQSSELLRVLGQLGDAAWAETLLPLLRAYKSAGAVALACKQLRELCHGNQRELRLTGTNCKQLDPLEVDAFSRPFPACTNVEFIADAADGAWLHFACVVPLLARLPKLQCLQLSSHSWAASQADRLVPVLQLLRSLLPQLRSLKLELHSNWVSGSQEAWKLLGATTQLTKLAIEFKSIQAGVPEFNLEHLSALRPLGSGLQHLELSAQRVNIIIPQDCSFLSSFSGLTSLRLPVINERSGLTAISSCTALQSLELCRHEQHELDAAECAALAQLTRLTELDIPPSSDMPAILTALRCLSGLQSLTLPAMSSSYLPVLASLTKLTLLAGSWVDGPTDQATLAAAGAAQHVCPSVVQVYVSGPFPLAAFPGAKVVVMMCDAWQPSRLVSLSQHMKALEMLCIGLPTAKSTLSSLDASARAAERVAAVRSLGQLSRLERIEFAPSDDAEAAALATACRRVNELWLLVPDGSSVTALGLATGLCNVSLHQLTVVLFGLQLSQSEARLLLIGWSGVRELTVILQQPEQQQVWEAAAAAARAVGLHLPAEYRFVINDIAD